MAIRRWLTAIGLGGLADTFEDNDIDLEVVPDLSEEDLKELGLTLGQRKRFLRAAQALDSAEPDAETDPADRVERVPAERRHLTVMFCDIVGSTVLSERLEAEDLLDVVRRYQTFSASIIGTHEGYIARYVGDGILAYFGYPMAHEDAPAHALHAALNIAEGIGALEMPADTKLAVRIGIASGVVIVGDMIGGGAAVEQPAIGVAPNLAARVQGIAGPNEVVVADVTYRLTQDAFDFEDMGSREFHGISEPVRTWRVLGEHRGDRSDVNFGRWSLTSFANRSEPLDLVRAQWQRVQEGRGQVLVISGEPGIGKSRLIHQFLREVEQEAAVQIYQATPYNQDSPLYPLIQRFRLVAGIDHGDGAQVIREKLAAVVQGEAAERDARTDIFAGLLTPVSIDSPQSQIEAKQNRERTLQAIVEYLAALSLIQPVVIVVDDFQWLDPTSIELLDRVIQSIPNKRTHVLVTSRSGFHAPWEKLAHVTQLELGRLPAKDTQALISSLAQGTALSKSLVGEIAEKADGIPLFVEELTKSVIEHNFERSAGGRKKRRNGETARVPISLQDSLMERLDRVGSAKTVARVGAVLGRSFSRELISTVGGFEPEHLDAALITLSDAGLVLREVDQRGRETFAFKHGLVQEAAYASLLREERKRLHASTAQGLRKLRPRIEEERPDLLAHHISAAGLHEESARLWLQAGRLSLAQSAIVEAVHHLRRGLEALDELTATSESKLLRLQLLIHLGPALISLHGPGSEEVEEIYSQGYALCRTLPESRDHFPVYWGWWRRSRDFNEMGRRADELLNRARLRKDDELMLQAHHCQWASHFNRGDFQGCLDHIDGGLDLYEKGDYRTHATLYGNHDAKVCGHGERGLVYWLLGRPEEALASERLAYKWMQELRHGGSWMHLKDITIMHRLYRRDAVEVLRIAQEMIDFAQEQGFSDHKAKALVFCGWAHARLGDPSRGLNEIREGLNRQIAIGTEEDFPIYYDMFAEVLALNGRIDEALEETTAAQAKFESLGLWIWAPELRRRIGYLLRLRMPNDPEPAIAAYHGALDLATNQGARALALRAATSLAGLLRGQGRSEDARRTLESHLVDLDSMADTPDYAAAAALLAGPRDRSSG
ncbi:AAA family ATPase [Pelagibius sp.]|uniref:AAA family ATPase n=1 Tax=Pelagibius sp. TaxID=1931238 RepID=UPI002620FEE2|nr:AAA family ATPase [Pelagibius sp.]